MLQTLMINEKESIKNKLKDAKMELNNSPNGRLECHVRKVHNKENQYKWYIVKKGKRTYLPKKEESIAIRLAHKRELKSKIGNYENQLIAIEAYLAIASGQDSKYLSKAAQAKVRKNKDVIHNKENPEITRLYQLYTKQKFRELDEWANADYFDWNYHPESLKVKSKTGRMVRSRIEAEIDKSLYDHHLYYRYEDQLILNGKIIHPDFTIIHPVTGKKIIWEHLGRLDEENYINDNCDKFWRYVTNGYYPNLNLIYTSESNASTLDLRKIEELIEIFLS